ncbi:uncharacterized protein [Vicugna pacos]|uniref:Uncharacterized protein n=1 Tax=Vicugna pacos TaxID=30538 RepID=A0ABM5CTP6_VICPA
MGNLHGGTVSRPIIGNAFPVKIFGSLQKTLQPPRKRRGKKGGRRNWRPLLLPPAFRPQGNASRPLDGETQRALLGRSPHTRQGTELRRRHNPGALAQPASPRRHAPARPTRRPLGPTRPPLACVARPAQAAQAPEDREGPRTTKATGRSPDPGLASPASGKGRERRGRRLGGPTWLRPRAARGDPGRSDPRAGAGGTQLRPPPAPAVKQLPPGPGSQFCKKIKGHDQQLVHCLGVEPEFKHRQKSDTDFPLLIGK